MRRPREGAEAGFAPAGPRALGAARPRGFQPLECGGEGGGWEHSRCRLDPGFVVRSDVPTPVPEPRGVSGGARWPCANRPGRCQVADLATTLFPGRRPKGARHPKAVVLVHSPQLDPLGPGHG